MLRKHKKSNKNTKSERRVKAGANSELGAEVTGAEVAVAEAGVKVEVAEAGAEAE